MASDAGEFSLIVVEVESSRIADAAKAFGRAFSLDDTIATQICKSAPIIFAQKLSKQEVKAITPTLGDLSKNGMEFRVTARVAGKLPKVNWPVRPQFTAGGAPAVNGLAFEWDNNAFVCPGCGESFLFRRLGKLQLAEPQVVVGTNGAEAYAAAPAVSARAGSPQPVKSTIGASTMDFAESAMPAPRAVGVEGVAPLAGEGESLDLPEALEDIRSAAAPEPELMPEEPLLPEPEPLPAPEPLEELSGSAGGFAAEAEPLAPTEPEPLAEAPMAEPEAPPAEEEAPAEAGELYNVFLSKITDTSKRDKAAELISKVKGCSTSEAKELTTRLVIPLAKNVSKTKAEDILNQFKKLKIFGRMTKVK